MQEDEESLELIIQLSWKRQLSQLNWVAEILTRLERERECNTEELS